MVDSDLYLPGGVAADPATAAVFFTDAGSEGLLHVERAEQNGSDRRLLYRGRHPQAVGLQLVAGNLYWTDSAGVWRLPLTADRTSAAADAEMVAPLTGRASALLVMREDEQCASYEVVTATAVPGVVSQSPEESCDNYCVVGKCRWNELHGRSCRCPPGYFGQRCERDACQSYCLAGGTCYREADGGAVCVCPDGTDGDRCELQHRSVWRA